MAAIKSLTNGTVNATTTEAKISGKFHEILFVANDDTTNDLILSLGMPYGDADAVTIILKPGESRENYPASYNTIYYKSSAGEVAFRLELLRK